jgi:hypothetical protein
VLPARLVINLARDAGISLRTLKRAKCTQGVRTVRRGFGAGSSWFWSLPEPAGAEGGQKGAEEGHAETWPPSREVGPLREPGGDTGELLADAGDGAGAAAGEVGGDTKDGQGADAQEPRAAGELVVPAAAAVADAKHVGDTSEAKDSGSPSTRTKDCLL